MKGGKSWVCPRKSPGGGGVGQHRHHAPPPPAASARRDVHCKTRGASTPPRSRRAWGSRRGGWPRARGRCRQGQGGPSGRPASASAPRKPSHSAERSKEVTVHYRWHPFYDQVARVNRGVPRDNGEVLFCGLITCGLLSAAAIQGPSRFPSRIIASSPPAHSCRSSARAGLPGGSSRCESGRPDSRLNYRVTLTILGG